MDDLPAWQALVVGLLGGVVGAVLTTLLRIGHERAQWLREQRLRAADQFVTCVAEALAALRKARWTSDTPAERSEALGHADEHIREALTRLALVNLLFGYEPRRD